MGIRETSYYGWQNFVTITPTPTWEIILQRANRLHIDAVGNIYIASSIKLFGGNEAYTVNRSKDDGKTWEIVDWISSSLADSEAFDIISDVSGNIYAAGREASTISGTSNWVVRKSATGDNGSFATIDSFAEVPVSGGHAQGMAIDSSGSVYVVGSDRDAAGSQNWIVRKSTTGASGTFSYVDSMDRAGFVDAANSVAIDSDDNVYVVGYSERTSNPYTEGVVRRSTTGASGSFSYVDAFSGSYSAAAYAGVLADIAIDSSDNIYVAGYHGGFGTLFDWIVRKSATGASGSFSYIDSVDVGASSELALTITIDSNDSVYVGGATSFGESGTGSWRVRKSLAGASGSFFDIDNYYGNQSWCVDLKVVDDGTIYGAGYTKGLKEGLLRKGKLTANSASLGPRMLATSIGYVQSEISGTTYERFKLNNISEFPHSSGIFQMRNLVLGTTDAGKIGRTDDSIVQVTFVGSVVKVMWPKQDDQTTPIKGYGDLAAGQRSGKLVSSFEPGDYIDVTDFDHMSLYCYLLKNASGTLDNIDIKIERRPLKSTGFSTDQVIEYSSSGSVTIAELKDLVYRKQIDYGDLSISEIGYPIDVPLTNVREVRISAKHQTGQIEENKNFVVWGRFIKSTEET